MGSVVPLVKLPLYHTEQSHCPQKEELCGGETTSSRELIVANLFQGPKQSQRVPPKKEIVLMNHAFSVSRTVNWGKMPVPFTTGC